VAVAAWADPHVSLDDLDAEGDLVELNLGPQHPSTHGVLRVKLVLDGERCVKATPYLGYLHRGVEKLCEKLTYVQIPSVLDKNDYVSPVTNELAFCLAVERMLGTEAPPRAQYLRTIGAEMQRVSSHLLWLGTFALDLGGAIGGGASVFMHTFRERETILDCFELLTGARFHYNWLTPGGCRYDAPPGWDRQVRDTLAAIEARVHEYHAMLAENPIFLARTRGVGVLDRQLALECGVGGPNGRASGIDFDLRRDQPYEAYRNVEVRVPTRTAGDCLARYEVRLAEMLESIRLVNVLLDGLPEGSIDGLKAVKLPMAVKVKAGIGYGCIESPRGELGHWIVADGGDKPYRCKIRPPSYHAMSLLPYMAPGNLLSDVIVILGSLDPIMGEVDR
jgi:NADH-quinone oxidoreductase subunit D